MAGQSDHLRGTRVLVIVRSARDDNVGDQSGTATSGFGPRFCFLCGRYGNAVDENLYYVSSNKLIGT